MVFSTLIIAKAQRSQEKKSIKLKKC